MKLSGLHLLLTYECNLECDHCFVWGGPCQSGTMTMEKIREILRQAEGLGTVEWIYFEGGEPFLYYALLLRAVELAAHRGFRVGIVSNGYWATDVDDAVACLKPFAGLIQDLSISDDEYHWGGQPAEQPSHAVLAARMLGIPVGVISVAQPEAGQADLPVGQLPEGKCAVMYRGRAAEKLVGRGPRRPWTAFEECPCEDLREPGRVHVDPFGFVHICQGLTVGNLFREPLAEICAGHDPDRHAITGPLLRGGPSELVRRYGLPHDETYADACHLCYEARAALRGRFAEVLTPPQMYGVC